MCPTPLGRIETRTFILIGPALIGAVLSLVTGNAGWIVLIGIYLILGVALDLVVYPLVIKWQPPWLTGVLGVVEFVLLYLLARVLNVGLTPVQAIVWYWVAWAIARLTRIVVLPLLSLSYVENGTEFRSTGWSIPAEQESIPLVARPEGGRAGALLREFSAVNEVPHELRRSPSLSRVHAAPANPAGRQD
jgi:hypothetical protein